VAAALAFAVACISLVYLWSPAILCGRIPFFVEFLHFKRFAHAQPATLEISLGFLVLSSVLTISVAFCSAPGAFERSSCSTADLSQIDSPHRLAPSGPVERQERCFSGDLLSGLILSLGYTLIVRSIIASRHSIKTISGMS
jgi:hypothetical protein